MQVQVNFLSAKPNVRSERVLRKKALGIMLIPIKLLTLSSLLCFFFLIRVFKLSLSLMGSNGLISLHTYIAVELTKPKRNYLPFLHKQKERESILCLCQPNVKPLVILRPIYLKL